MTLLDPAVNAEFRRLKAEVRRLEDELKAKQDELDAVPPHPPMWSLCYRLD